MSHIFAIKRPARLLSGKLELEWELHMTRHTHHRLLDFEDVHQRVLDEVAEIVAPNIVRVGRLFARLMARKWRMERSTGWSLPLHEPWRIELGKRLKSLRLQRNTDPRWKAALKWADTPSENAPQRGNARRRPNETDAEFELRVSQRRTLLTRREAWRAELYAARTIYWGTWNGLIKQVDQARSSVLAQRKEGVPANWHRPRWDKPTTLYADRGGFRVHRENKCWEVEIRLFEGWARFRLSSHGQLPSNFTEFRTAKVTRTKNGAGWDYSVSLTVASDAALAATSGAGIVAFDGGYREFGHETAEAGIRAFRWLGNDGGSGEILLPAECRKLADLNKHLLSKLDTSFSELGLPHRSRHHYRSVLMRSGVRTEWENAWLGDERRVERRVAANRKRIENLRKETYLQASKELMMRYSTFIFEDTKGQELRDIGTDKQALRRSRQNRDLVAEYGFRELCERRGADVVTVDARNSTRECPDCGHLCKTTAKLLIQCESCNKVRDQDIGAARVLLRRGIEALEKRVASNQKAS